MKDQKLIEKLNQVKRQHIIEVAQELFFKKGYENTGMDEIASRADISKSTLYTYIKSKEELFMYIHLQGMRERYVILNEIIKTLKTGYERIYTIAQEYYHFFRNNRGYFKLYLYEDYNSIDRGKISTALVRNFDDLLNSLIAIVRDSFELGIRDHTIRNDMNVGYLDKYFAYTIRTILNIALTPEKTRNIKDNFNEEEFYYQYIDLFMTAIKPSD